MARGICAPRHVRFLEDLWGILVAQAILTQGFSGHSKCWAEVDSQEDSMAERYLITQASPVEGAAVPELIKLKQERNKKLSEEKTEAAKAKDAKIAEERSKLEARTADYEKEYSSTQAELVKLRREAKVAGNFFVEPEAKLLFVVRIVGIIKLSPKPRKVLQLLRLKQLHNGVFLKVNKAILNMLKLVQPYVTYGYPSLKTVRELVYKRGYGKVSALLHGHVLIWQFLISFQKGFRPETTAIKNYVFG